MCLYVLIYFQGFLLEMTVTTVWRSAKSGVILKTVTVGVCSAAMYSIFQTGLVSHQTIIAEKLRDTEK